MEQSMGDVLTSAQTTSLFGACWDAIFTRVLARSMPSINGQMSKDPYSIARRVHKRRFTLEDCSATNTYLSKKREPTLNLYED